MTKLAFAIALSTLVGAAVSTHGAVAKAAKKKPAPPPAHSSLRHIGGAGAWQAYVYTGKSGLVCYLVGDPQKTEPPRFARKPPVAMVTHRPEEHVFDVVSFTEGYPLKPGSNVSVDVGGTKFSMFTNDDTAWSRTSEIDRSLVAAMEKGRDAIVKGTPAKGPQTTDTYSLEGFTHSLRLIDRACKVKQ